MSTANIARNPAAVLIARRVDFPTWLPAMLVKELRQGLRARGFVGALVGFQMLMTLFTAFALAGGTGSASFNILQSAYWVMLSVQLLIVTPARALMGMQGELESRSVDLLMLTRLTAWRVVIGKWISLLVQAALLVMAMLPYGVARYFFGSVDLVSEARLIAVMFAGCAVATAGALWASAMPKIARAVFGMAVVFGWQFMPGSLSMLMSGRPARPMGPAFGLAGGNMVLVLYDAALLLLLCLVGAVRRLAPRAESQAPLMRALPVLALLPAPFLGLRDAAAQIAGAAVLFGFIAALELARDEEPMACHWRTWARFGVAGRALGRLLQPGWASALEWVLVMALAGALAGLATPEPLKVAHLAMLGAEALIFPVLLLSWMSAQFTQRAAGYALVLLGASLISAVGAASASVFRTNDLADLLLQLLPISSFWATAMHRTTLTTAVIVTQTCVAAYLIGIAWWRARPYRLKRRAFAVRTPASGGTP